jgi:hypothetical protein
LKEQISSANSFFASAEKTRQNILNFYPHLFSTVRGKIGTAPKKWLILKGYTILHSFSTYKKETGRDRKLRA